MNEANALLNDPVVALHALAATVVLALGPVQILRRRRDAAHRSLGRSWVAAMVVVCTSSFWVGERFSWLHALSAWTLVSVGLGVVSAVRGNIPAHRANMIGSYLGTLAAFVFASLAPGRAIPGLAAEDPLTLGGLALLAALTAAALYLTFRPRPRPEARTTRPPVRRRPRPSAARPGPSAGRASS
jgi:uncharacterized membrane protein